MDENSSSSSDEFDEFIDPIDAELVIKDDYDEGSSTAQAPTSWSSYFSSAATAADNGSEFTSSPWNVNELFRSGFRIHSPPQDAEVTHLEEDLQSLLALDEAHSNEIYVSRVRILLQRFLGLQHPRLTDQMLEFLLSDGVLEIYVSYLTRIHPSLTLDYEWAATFLSEAAGKLASGAKIRDVADQDLVKMSAQAVAVLCGTNPLNIRFLDLKLRDIIVFAFDIFHPDADGDFGHFRDMFKNFLERAPFGVLDVFLSRFPASNAFLTDSHQTLKSAEYQRPLIFRCLHFLHHPAVAEIMFMALVKKFTENSEDEFLQKRRFEVLVDEGFMEALLDLLFNGNPSEHKTHIVAVSDFIVRWVEEAAVIKHSDVLFKSIVGPQTTSRFLNCLYSPDTPDFHFAAVLNVFHAFCVKSLTLQPRVVGILEKFSETDLMSPKDAASSILEPLSQGFCKQLGAHLVPLCKLIANGRVSAHTAQTPLKYSSFTVQNPLGAYRIYLLEVLVNVVKVFIDEGDVLATIPAGFWKTILSWFLVYKFNNTLHGLYYRLVYLVLKSGNKPTMKNMLGRTHLIQLFVRSFNDSEVSSGNRGHMVLIFNVLRLFGELQHANDYVPQLLNSCEEWKEFWPTLKRETLRQVTQKTMSFTNEGRPLSEPHFGPPLKLNSSGNATSAVVSFTQASPGDTGIHLGSAYATSLGFPLPTFESNISSPVVGLASPNKRKKKKKSKGNSADSDSSFIDEEDTSLTDDSASDVSVMTSSEPTPTSTYSSIASPTNVLPVVHETSEASTQPNSSSELR